MADDAVQDITRTVQGLSLGERLAVLGALGVLAVWLIFDLALQEYGVAHLPFALALLLVFCAYRVRAQHSPGFAVPYETIVVACASFLGIIGGWELIYDTRNYIFDAEAITIVGAIGYWAASIAAGLGALQMWTAGRS